MTTMGKLIKMARTSKNLSQSTLAQELGVSKNYVSLLENDKKDPSVGLVKKMAKILGVPAVLLLWDQIELPTPRSGKEKEITKDINSIADRARLLFIQQHLQQ